MEWHSLPVLLAALRLNLFATLQEQPSSAADLAQRLKSDPRGTMLLLETLAALGYLKQRRERFHLTTMTRKWLTDAGPANLTPFFLFWGAMVEKLTPTLTEAIRTGSPPLNLYDWLATGPEITRHFQAGLAAMEALWNKQRWWDEYLYAILDYEWKAQQTLSKMAAPCN